VDLTREGFQLFAVLPRDISAPKITTTPGADGFVAANVDVGMRGVPVQITVTQGGQSVTLYGASGVPVALPIRGGDAGTWTVEAKELLSDGSAKIEVKAAPATPAQNDEILTRFAARKDVPLVVALTPEQSQNAQIVILAKRIADSYGAKGRKVETRALAPGEVVLGLQPFRAMQKFPQWRTVDADLVLLGTPQTNVLLGDQARGGLLKNRRARR
jgi:hypothetical protein